MNIGAVEYSHPSKFVASLGVGFVILGMGIQWFALRVVQPMLLSESEYIELTPVGKNLFNYRLNFMESIQPWLWPFTIISVLLGFILISCGLISWWRLQSPQDEVARGEAFDAIEQRRTMTAAEQKIKLEAETNESIDEDESPSVVQDLDSKRSGQSSVATDAMPGHEKPIAQHDVSKSRTPRDRQKYNVNRDERRIRIAAIESVVGEKLEAAYRGVMKIDRNQKLSGGGQLDFVLSPPAESSFAEIGIEVRVMSRPNVWFERDVVQVALAAAGLKPGRVFTGRRGQPPLARTRGILVFVFIEPLESTPRWAQASQGSLEKFARHRLDRINAVLKEPVGHLVLDGEKIENLDPADFKLRLTSALIAP